MTSYGPFSARCVAIHDGDTATFDISLPFGFYLPGLDWNGKTNLSCRVYGINAPELATDAGKAALAFAEAILHVGDICLVTSHGWDKYGGRFDGSITLPDGSDFAQLMLDSGHARPYAGLTPGGSS